MVFAVPNNAEGQPDNAWPARGVARDLRESLGSNWATLVLFISASAQFFCATSCLTSASRMTFAFSRDGAIPGSETLVEADRQAGARQRGDDGARCCAAMVTLPALIEVDVGTGRRRSSAGAFYAVTSIAVIGLYLSFAIPIWLRWRHGDRFEVGLVEQRRRSTSG